MYLQINIESENAAFDESPVTETVRILENIIEKLNGSYYEFPVKDINGNTVGDCFYSDEPKETSKPVVFKTPETFSVSSGKLGRSFAE